MSVDEAKYFRPVVILLSPHGERNVGGVVRAMGNFGLEELRIISPRCNTRNLEAKRMSMQSYSILENAKYFDSFEEARADREVLIALSGRAVEAGRPQESLHDFVEKIPQRFSSQTKAAFVFGREEWGMKLEELDQCDFQVYIPTSELRPSINLSSAAAIAFSEYFRVVQSMPATVSAPILRPLKVQEDHFFERIADLVWKTKFANPQNPEHILTDLRAMYHRAEPSARDLRILFGMLSAVEDHLRE